MKKNVKVIASLVRKAKKKLLQDKREEALELMKKALNVDDNNGVLVQVIQVIGRKKLVTEPEDEPLVTPEVPVVEQAEPEPVEDFEDAWLVEQPEPEPVEDLEEAWLVEQPEPEPAPEAKAVENNQERNKLMASEDQLTKLFEASDREYDNGHQQKAIAYLKRALKFYPDNPEVQLRIDLLKTKIKSDNLVQIARKRFALGEVARAVVLARQAFSMRPDTTGLEELLADLESSPGVSSPTSAVSEEAQSSASGEYIARIRQLVQDNFLEEAASVAEQAFDLFPDESLVLEFVDNFKKLGLLE